MRAIVTVFKAELENKEDIRHRLENFSEDVNQVGNAYVFVPRSGVLIQFLNVLADNKIIYGTHFNSIEN